MAAPTDGDEPREDSEAVAEGGRAAVATTAARALATGAALTGSDALVGLEDDLQAAGVRRLPRPWGGWDERRELFDASDRVLHEFDLLDEIREREEQRWRPVASAGGEPERLGRVDLWRRLSVTPQRRNAIAWLRMLMTDREPVAAAASAVALSSWRRPQDSAIPPALEAARDLRIEYARSGSPGAQLIARAADPSLESPQAGSWRTIEPSDDRHETVSTIVHGTHGWIGPWWYPGDDFHSYLRENVIADLYSGGAVFSWSGRYRPSDRTVAAERLAAWAQTTAGGQLNTLFGHSYGGVIALAATAHGLRAERVVLLSTPVDSVPIEWRNIGRAQSLRIHLDLVLLAARRRQRFTENVEEFYLPQWFWSHSDSHEPTIWQAGDWSNVLELIQ